jgi:Tol biopolymer transport system component
MTRWRGLRVATFAALVLCAGVSSAQAAHHHEADAGLAVVVPGARIATAMPDGSGQVTVSAGPGKDVDPAFSPDGAQIAFESTRTGGGDIYVMNADGTGVVQLTSDPGEDAQPTWSPNGSQIAFTRCGSTNCNIWAMTSAGANQHQVTNGPGNADLETDPAWSPGGHWIAFRAILAGQHCNKITIVRPDGTGRRAVTNCTLRHMGGTQDFSPTWSPDGDRIAFWRFYDLTVRRRIDRIMVMSRGGSHLHAITPASMSASDPAWSPDGTEIAFTRHIPHENGTLIVRPDGVDPILVAAHTKAPAWRPVACTMNGTSSRDLIFGTPGNDVICGLGGDDMIAGRGGQDIISGGRGEDAISFGWAPAGVRVRVGLHAFAGGGKEFLSGFEDVYGSPFGDVVRGGGVANVIHGLAGGDEIFGGLGRDRLLGGASGDTIDARDGLPGDEVSGGPGVDVCRADVGDLVRRC